MALVRATHTFHGAGNVFIAAGDLLEDSDPLVKRCPDYFEPVAATRGKGVDVEAAVARPGQKRGSKRASKRAATKSED